MSNPGDADETPIESVRQLVEYIAAGCKPPEEFRIGTEHEKFGFRRADLTPPPYDPQGIRDLLEAMSGSGSGEHGWMPIFDGINPIGLKKARASVSLEPAGQLELSGGTLDDLHRTKEEFAAHYAHVRAAATPLGLGFSPLGFHPTMRRDQMPWMPKGRYAIMRRYMPLVGSMGLDMMTRTCTVQVNLDYASEHDMAQKLRVSLALQPLATALFANSPFTEGRANGFMSYRAHVWTDTDNARSGMPEIFFDKQFGFERYVDWLLNVPMYFVTRDDRHIDLAGRSFRDFMAGRLTGVGPATLGDFADHMTTAFTDVRVKQFLEMRGADAGNLSMMVAQSALWVGLLYDPATLAAADKFVQQYQIEDFIHQRASVPRAGLQVAWRDGTLRDFAREVLLLAVAGLRGRARLNGAGQDESIYLEPLLEIVAGAPNQAEMWIERYNGIWRGDVTRIFRETAI